MRSFVTATLLAIVSFAGSNTAHAAGTYWSAAAATCVPGDPAIQSDRYLVQAGKVQHTASSVDLVTLYCPVERNTGADDPNRLYMTWNDSSSAPGANVKAQLIRMSKTTGALTTIATLDSNSSGTGLIYGSVGFTEALNWGQNYYYVRVDLDRNNTSEIEQFFGVELSKNID